MKKTLKGAIREIPFAALIGYLGASAVYTATVIIETIFGLK